MKKRQIKGFRRLRMGDDGQAMVEFAITFPWVLLITLAVMQFALMYNAKNVVDYAAFCGARSATVWIPRYEVLTVGGWNQTSQPGRVDRLKKYMKVHVAVAMPLLPVSPGVTRVTQGWPGIGMWMSLINQIYNSLSGTLRSIAHGLDRFAYAYAAVSVNEFMPYFGCGVSISDNVNSVRWGTGHTISEGSNNRGDIVIQVTYYDFLEIPFINHFIAQWGPRLSGRPVNPPTALGGRNSDTNFWPLSSYCVMPYEGRTRAEWDEAKQWTWYWP